MSKRAKYLIGAALAGFFVVAYVASPYWAVYQMRSAAEARDGDRLATYIDFPSVRESVKSQVMASFAESMATELKDNPFGGLAGAFAAKMVDGLVDTFVTPDGLARLIEKGKPEAPLAGASAARSRDGGTAVEAAGEAGRARPNVSQRYKDLDSFEVAISGPEGETGPLVLRFRRSGLFQWRVTSLRIPFPAANQASVTKTVAVPSTPPSPRPALSSTKESDRRIQSLEQAVVQDPGNADAWARLGNEYFDTHAREKAVEAYDRALTLRPGSPSVLSDRGVMYRELGRFEDAVADFRAAARLDPKHVQSLFNLGVVYLNDLKQPEKAIEAWKKVIEIAPGTQQAADARLAIEDAKKVRR